MNAPLPEAADIRALIISRPDRIGDVIISTSCLAPVRARFPEAEIYFLANETLRPLLENHPLLAGFISQSADFVRVFRDLHASVIVHLHPDQGCYRAARDAGIPLRIGYEKFEGDLLTHAVSDRRSDGLQHEGLYNFDLLRILGVEPPPVLTPSVHLTPSSKTSLQSKLPWRLDDTRYAVLCPSAYSRKKQWPADRFEHLAEQLRNEFGLAPVFIGAQESETVRVGDGGLNISGKTDLGELAWLLTYARLLISNDTGPSHLGAAVACPLVIIFGRTAPEYGPTRWRPLSERTAIVTQPIRKRLFEGNAAYWKRSFAAISVDDVMDACRRVLQSNANKISHASVHA